MFRRNDTPGIVRWNPPESKTRQAGYPTRCSNRSNSFEISTVIRDYVGRMQAQNPDEMEGVIPTSGEPQNPLMTEDERRILEVYDRLEELQLEIALLKSQGVFSQRKLMNHILFTYTNQFQPHQRKCLRQIS